MLLQIKNLSVTYRGHQGYVPALKDVSFTINSTEALGVVGESGSGKSTLANAILNLLPIDAARSGQIVFKEKDIFSLNEKTLKNTRGNQIGLIFQEPAGTFNPVFTVGYQLEELLKFKRHIQSKAERQRIIFDVFKRVRLPEAERILKSYPHQLSGGQLQRLSIAMAISLKPSLLIADEPTSSLDVTTESQIMYLFKELVRELKLTIMFITHNLDLVKILCERVVVLYQGQVREVKERDKLFAHPQDRYTQSLLAALKRLEED